MDVQTQTKFVVASSGSRVVVGRSPELRITQTMKNWATIARFFDSCLTAEQVTALKAQWQSALSVTDSEKLADCLFKTFCHAADLLIGPLLSMMDGLIQNTEFDLSSLQALFNEANDERLKNRRRVVAAARAIGQLRYGKNVVKSLRAAEFVVCKFKPQLNGEKKKLLDDIAGLAGRHPLSTSRSELDEIWVRVHQLEEKDKHVPSSSLAACGKTASKGGRDRYARHKRALSARSIEERRERKNGGRAKQD